MSVLAKIGSIGSFNAPEKWCIKTTPETREIVYKFMEEKGYYTTSEQDYYCHYPFVYGTGCLYYQPNIDYTEITFDEFLKITF
jgi:hypothetical protein